MIKIDIATLFAPMCENVLEHSIIGRARKAEKLKVECHDIRAYTLNKHRRVDDTPYGGGMGMLLQAEPIYRCYQNVCRELSYKPYTIYLSPQGTVFNQKKAIELSKKDHLFLICGHYEGVDQRLIDEIVDEEISMGDYVLTGGELAALTLVDSVGRLCDGVLSDQSCFIDESHYNGILEYPQYTKPAVWNGRAVPDVLLSGHHANIEQWRKEKSIQNTINKRPDLLACSNLKAK